MADRATLKHWREVHGVKRDIAKPFIDAGATYDQAKPYIESDWYSRFADDWASLNVPVETAQFWEMHGAISWNYRAWVNQMGKDPDDVTPWFDAGFAFEDCFYWSDFAREGSLRDQIDPNADNAEILALAIDHREQTGSVWPYWIALGFDFDQIKRLAKVEDRLRSQYHLDKIIELLKAKHATLDQAVDELIEWNRSGLRDASYYIEHNATVEQATEWEALGHRDYEYAECHLKTGELMPNTYDEFVTAKVVELLSNLDRRIEHVNHSIRGYPVDQMLEIYTEVKNDWDKAVILMAEVFDRIDNRIDKRKENN